MTIFHRCAIFRTGMRLALVGDEKRAPLVTGDYFVKKLLATFALLAIGSAHAVTPKTGIWYSPAESGRGYAIEVNGNTMVLAMYAYDSSGNPLWYLASGSLTNNGANFQSTLDKYAGGQCVTCDYTAPTLNGNDGVIAIQFTSDTSGVVTLPGGHRVNIQPFFGPPSGGTLGGLPLSFEGIDMLQFDTEDHSFDCEVKLTFRNSTTSSRTAFLYFDVLDGDGVNVDQLIFDATSLASGATAQDSSYVNALDGESSPCEGFSLRFNADASRVHD
jgi:hypothetical protein